MGFTSDSAKSAQRRSAESRRARKTKRTVHLENANDLSNLDRIRLLDEIATDSTAHQRDRVAALKAALQYSVDRSAADDLQKRRSKLIDGIGLEDGNDG